MRFSYKNILFLFLKQWYMFVIFIFTMYAGTHILASALFGNSPPPIPTGPTNISSTSGKW